MRDEVETVNLSLCSKVLSSTRERERVNTKSRETLKSPEPDQKQQVYLYMQDEGGLV